MSNAPTRSFTHDHVLREDGTVTFRCSTDTDAWPWLKLDVHHPSALQAVHFWASVGASTAMGTFDPKKWSALTWTRWQIGDRGADQPVRGTMERGAEQAGTKERLSYRLTLFDARDRLAYEVEGKGVVFQTRDFPAWRAEAKSRTENAGREPFGYAPPELLGVQQFGFPFLSRLKQSGAPRADALITADNGLPPGHPYLDGSGDHVNSTHLSEVANQFVALCREGEPFRVTAGEMRFTHYIELGAPFSVEQSEYGEGTMSLELTQSGELCCIATLHFEDN